MGPNWAHIVDPSIENQAEPFFHLYDPVNRWITIKATPELYEGILETERDLHSQPSLLEDLSIYSQTTFLASIFAVHDDDGIRGSDEDWLGVVDKVLEVIASSHSGGTGHEMEQSKHTLRFSSTRTLS